MRLTRTGVLKVEQQRSSGVLQSSKRIRPIAPHNRVGIEWNRQAYAH